MRPLQVLLSFFRGRPGPPVFACVVVLSAVGLGGLALQPASSRAQTNASLVRDLNPGSNSSSPEMLTEVAGGSLFFIARTDADGRELWKSTASLDETTGEVSIDTTRLVRDINPGSAGAEPGELTGVGSTLFLIADDGENGRELWKSDGTTDGTEMVRSIRPGDESAIAPGGIGSHPGWLTAVDGTLFFAANDGSHGFELWKSDGTASGTEMVKDIWAGSEGSRPGGLTNVGGTLFFAAADSSHGKELWKSDGTATGTVMVKDLTGDSTGSAPDGLTNVDGALYFAGNDREHGWELWKSDGTAEGTMLVRDIRAGSESSFPAEITPLGDSVAFRANDGETGAELWISEGDSASTRQVEDIAPGETGSIPRHLTELGGRLFFHANDQTHGRELWRSDSAGTEMVKDIYPGSLSAIQRPISKAGAQLFFAAADGDTGSEPWVSDGTAEGTRLVEDVYPGSAGSSPGNFAELGGKVLFAAAGEDLGRELWQTVSPPAAEFEVVVPDGRTGDERAPISNVMRGGEFARYYRIRDEDGNLYAASDSVEVQLKNGRSASVDKNGLVQISGSTKDDEVFSGIRGTSDESLPQSVELDPVKRVTVGGREAIIERRPVFKVKVKEREWTRTGATETGLSAEAAVVIGFSTTQSGAISLSIDEQETLTIKRALKRAAGVTAGFDLLEAQLGLDFRCGVGGGVSVLQGLGDGYQLTQPFGDLSKERAGALVLLDLIAQTSTRAGAGLSTDLLLRSLQALDPLAQELLPPFQSESRGSVGLKGSLSGECDLSFLEGNSGENSEKESGMKIVGTNLNLEGGIHGYQKDTGSGREFLNTTETGVEAVVSLTPSAGRFLEFLGALGLQEKVLRQASLKVVTDGEITEENVEHVAASFGTEEETGTLVLRNTRDTDGNGTSDLRQVGEHAVDTGQNIAAFIKNFALGKALSEGIQDLGRLSWREQGILLDRLYNQPLQSIEDLAGEIRMDYRVVQNEPRDPISVGVPIGGEVYGVDVEIAPSLTLTSGRNWPKERGIVQCFEPPASVKGACQFEKNPSTGRPGVYWTERYEDDKFVNEETRTYQEMIEQLLGSLAPKLEEVMDVLDHVQKTIEAGKETVIAEGEAVLEVAANAVSGPIKAALFIFGNGGLEEKETGFAALRGKKRSLQAISRSYQLFPREQQLQEPATLTIGYSEDSLAAGTEEESLDIYRWDQQKGRWTATGGTVDPDSNEIETEISAFTTYAIARDQAPPAPPKLEATPDTAGSGSVHLNWTAPEAKDLAGYNVYRSSTAGEDYTRLNGSPLSVTTFTDETASLDSTLFYAVTAVDAAGNESPRFGATGGPLRSTRASAAARVYAGGTVDFGATGVDLRIPNPIGSGQVAVTKRQGTPAQPEGISQSNVSSFRYVTEREEKLGLTSGMEVRLDTSRIAGLEDPTNVVVYGRAAVGSGPFAALPTDYDSTAGEVVAQAGHFGELALASETDPLPVELTGLSAQLEEGEVLLRWQTASETNTAGFEVQRRSASPGRSSWAKVGFVKSKAPAGTTTDPHSYRFRDASAPYAADSLIYRLRQVDLDGSAHLFAPTVVRRSAPGEVQLQPPFPNPASGQATLRLALPERQEVTLRIYDVLGRQVATLKNGPMEAGRAQLQLDTSGLSSGTYFLRLTAESQTKTRKLTVVR